MEEQGISWMAVCGLDCSVCDIRRAPFDGDAAGRLVGWFQEMGWLKPDEGIAEAVERKMYCQGCHGNRSVHWSADCWILRCCVDEKGHQFCSQCADFPCARLEEWAAGNARYTQALNRLRSMV